MAPLEPLDVDALVQILTEPKNALVRQYKQLFNYEDIQLDFTEDALTEIAEQAIERETGARGLRSILEHILRKTMFDIPSQEDVEKCTIDAAVVKGEVEVHRVLRAPARTREQAGK